MFESEEFPGQFETDVCAFIDPRCHANGVRFLCTEASFEPDGDITVIKDDMLEYDLNRMLLGLPETGHELGGSLPLNVHLHNLNGVSFSKGCYIG